MKKFKRVVISFSLAICMIMCAVVADFGLPVNDNGDKTVGVVAYAATQVKTGCYNIGTNYSSKHRVYVKRGKTAKIKVCTFNYSGNITNGLVTIKISSPQNKGWYTTRGLRSNTSGQNYLYLGFGYTEYDLEIRRTSDSSTNAPKCHYWSLDATSNCWFW